MGRGVDVLKKLKSEAKARKDEPTPSHEPAHKIFVSSNWKSLIGKRPEIAPKAAASQTVVDLGAATSVVALDCEMVGVGDGKQSALARVSIVNHSGDVLLDRFVRPDEQITDYRSHITGITKQSLSSSNALSEQAARRKVAELIQGKIVVGHALQNDFQVLNLEHPHILIRDTSIFRPLRPPGLTKTPGLKMLAQHWLNEKIQEGQHDSVEDARIALRLYRLKSRHWEKQLASAMKQSQVEVSGPSAKQVEKAAVKATVQAQANPKPKTKIRAQEESEEDEDDEDDEGEVVERAPAKTVQTTGKEGPKNLGKKQRARLAAVAAAAAAASTKKGKKGKRKADEAQPVVKRSRQS